MPATQAQALARLKKVNAPWQMDGVAHVENPDVLVQTFGFRLNVQAPYADMLLSREKLLQI